MNATQCSVFRDLSHSVEYHLLTATKGILCSVGAFRITSQWRQYVRWAISNYFPRGIWYFPGSPFLSARKHENYISLLSRAQYRNRRHIWMHTSLWTNKVRPVSGTWWCGKFQDALRLLPPRLSIYFTYKVHYWPLSGTFEFSFQRLWHEFDLRISTSNAATVLWTIVLGNIPGLLWKKFKLLPFNITCYHNGKDVLQMR